MCGQLTALALAMTVPTSAGDRRDPHPQLTMTIHVMDRASVGARTMRMARQHVDRVFSQIGVEVLWIDDSAGTLGSGDVTDISVCLLSDDMVRRKTDFEGPIPSYVLAQAGLGAGRCWIFYERVERAAARNSVDPGIALGRTMVHELGHLIAGMEHGDSGAMRSAVDLTSPFPCFTGEQGTQIRAALQGAPGMASLARRHPASR
jgi:hypothetical protein